MFEQGWRVHDRIAREKRRKECLALRNAVEEKNNIEIHGVSSEDILKAKVSARPNGLREKASSAISFRWPGSDQKEE